MLHFNALPVLLFFCLGLVHSEQ